MNKFTFMKGSLFLVLALSQFNVHARTRKVKTFEESKHINVHSTKDLARRMCLLHVNPSFLDEDNNIRQALYEKGYLVTQDTYLISTALQERLNQPIAPMSARIQDPTAQPNEQADEQAIETTANTQVQMNPEPTEPSEEAEIQADVEVQGQAQNQAQEQPYVPAPQEQEQPQQAFLDFGDAMSSNPISFNEESYASIPDNHFVLGYHVNTSGTGLQSHEVKVDILKKDSKLAARYIVMHSTEGYTTSTKSEANVRYKRRKAILEAINSLKSCSVSKTIGKQQARNIR